MKSALVVAVLVVGASLMSVASAGAAPPGDQPDFKQQARAAGLTPEQVAYLDEQSDYYLSTMGGRRISPNQIDVNGTATVNIALPGESHPRDLTSKGDDQLSGPPCVDAAGAPYEYFCAFEFEYLHGDSIAMYNCVDHSIPWVTIGSWENNQTPGTRPMAFYTNSGSERLPAAYSLRYTGVNWLYITAIRPCD